MGTNPTELSLVIANSVGGDVLKLLRSMGNTTLPTVDYELLNPKIRHTIKVLRGWGFDTRDSGDGETQQYECDLPCPYVHIKINHAIFLSGEMIRLKKLLLCKCGIEIGMCNESGSNPTMEGCVLADMSAWIHLFNVVIKEDA